MKFTRQIVYILLLTVLLAVARGITLDHESWEGKESGSLIFEDLHNMANVLWIDARAREAYESGHVPDAIHLNEDNWEEGLSAMLLVWEPDRPIIVYCDGGGCESSKSVSIRLRRELGMDSIFWLKGGWDELKTREVNP